MPPDTSSKHLVRTQVAPSAVSSLLPARCSRCLHILLCPRLFHSSTKKFSSRSRSLRRSSVRVCARYDPGSTNPQTSYSSPIPANLRSAVHAVPFNQQLLIVLCIPAAALGLPFILSHPLTCIVLPLVVYFTPGMQEVVKPLLSALLQLILSGLRPSGSAKSGAFPWQQANHSPYASPPIDVEYQALPGEVSDAAYSQAQSQASTSSGTKYTRQAHPSTSYESSQAYDAGRQRVPLKRQFSTESVDAMQQRRKVSITPSHRQSRHNGRIVRQAAPGQVGVNIGSEDSAVTEPNSNLVRALLGVFPFLRHWGGFL